MSNFSTETEDENAQRAFKILFWGKSLRVS